jgi:hypothetical protein
MATIIFVSIFLGGLGLGAITCMESRLRWIIGIPLTLVGIFALFTLICASEAAKHPDYATIEIITAGELIKASDCYGEESMTINGVNSLYPGRDDFFHMWTLAGNGKNIADVKLIVGNQYTIYKQPVFLGNNYLVVCK